MHAKSAEAFRSRAILDVYKRQDLGRAASHIDFIRPAFPYDGVCGAFRRAAARHGFIERYQAGKEALTGICLLYTSPPAAWAA